MNIAIEHKCNERRKKILELRQIIYKLKAIRNIESQRNKECNELLNEMNFIRHWIYILASSVPKTSYSEIMKDLEVMKLMYKKREIHDYK